MTRTSLSTELDNSENLSYNNYRGKSYVRTDEFRKLQADSQGLSKDELSLYRSGNKSPDESLRGRLSGILSRQVESVCGKRGNDNGILNLSAKDNQFNLYQNVDGELFHDVFEIARSYLRNGELVDLHGVNTTDDGIGYKDCFNYLSQDGLSGFSITPDGDLISVFNTSNKKGFLRAIAQTVNEKAQTLDCYASKNQNLMEMYEKTFGFKTASVMEYNMEYDHDNIAQNHGDPQVAFMVNTDSDVATRYFTKDEYTEAVAYRDSFVNQPSENNIAPVKKSLSYEGEEASSGTPLNSMYRGDIAPVRDDIKPKTEIANNIAPVKETDESSARAITPTATEANDNIAPTKAEQIATGKASDDLLRASLDNHPVKTVEDVIREKIRAVDAEIADNKQLRKEAESLYKAEIARLISEYNSKKNKNTKYANNLLRRIEDLEKRKASVDADYSKRISDREARLEKMNTPEYSRAMHKQSKMQEYAEWAENLLGDTSTWKDKKTGIQYEVNTLHRNLRDIVKDADGNKDISKADAIYDELQGTYNTHEAEAKRENTRIKSPFAEMKITNEESAYIQMLGEFRSNPSTTLTEKDVNEYYEKHKNKIDKDKVDKAIKLAHETYDNLFSRVNKVLQEQGMKEIP